MKLISIPTATFVTLQLLFGFPQFIDARSWRSIIDHDIHSRSNIELARMQLKREADPFFFGQDSHTVPPVEPSPPVATSAPKPVASPTPAPNKWVTLPPSDSPTLLPTVDPKHTQVPSDLPSLAPTEPVPTALPTSRENNVDGNGGCHEGSILYQVNMRDQFGDGWDFNTVLKIEGIEDQQDQIQTASTITTTKTEDDGQAVVTVAETIEISTQEMFTADEATDGNTVDPLGTIFSGGLRQGYASTTDICLMRHRCYRVSVHGGAMLDEVSWDIRPVALGEEVQGQEPIVEGGAPSACSFSIPDEDGKQFCPTGCTSVPTSLATHDVAVGDDSHQSLNEMSAGSTVISSRSSSFGGHGLFQVIEDEGGKRN